MTQRTITRHAQAGDWPGPAIDSVTLDYDSRHRRRIRLTTDGGETVLLDLPKAVAMAHGDGLRLDDGRWIEVRAADEPLMEVICPDPLLMLRIAWHVGNRHLPTDIAKTEDGTLRLRLRPDHVIEEMIAGLGGTADHVSAPFQPEGGAYGGHGHPHGHSHGAHDNAAHDHADHDHAAE